MASFNFLGGKFARHKSGRFVKSSEVKKAANFCTGVKRKLSECATSPTDPKPSVLAVSENE